MSFQQHNFSNEVKNNLADFLRIVQSYHFQQQHDRTWNYLLPRNEHLINELNEIIDKLQKRIVIDLTDEDTLLHETMDKVDECKSTEISFNEQEQTSVISIRDVVESIKENLSTESTVSDDIFKHLAFNCNNNEICDIFNLLFNYLDLESICHLGHSLLSSNCFEKTQIATHYARSLLLPKLFVEYNKQLEILFQKFLDEFLTITSEEFSKRITDLENCPEHIQDNLNLIGSKYKQKLLRDFVLRSAKLTPAHFPIIESLLSKELDVETLQKLIELIIAASATYNSDKAFGKMLVHVIKFSERNIVHFQQQLSNVVDLHQSIWKNKLKKQIDDSLNDIVPLSQSLRY